MRLDRHQHLLEEENRIRDWFRLWRHEKHPGYVDSTKGLGNNLPFKHSAALLSKMTDLRIWTLWYAPNHANPLKRIQEIHKITSEFHYIQYRIMWRRVLPLMIALGVASRVLFKETLMNKGEKDAFEMSWRDVYILNK